jgi:hypothetical protein
VHKFYLGKNKKDLTEYTKRYKLTKIHFRAYDPEALETLQTKECEDEV